MKRAARPFDVALAGFERAMRIAEVHRRELKQRFGFTDAMIGTAVLARRKSNAYRDLAKSVIAAKERMKP